jgi:hypothetical protein
MFQFAPHDILSGVLGTLRTAGGPPIVRAVKVTGAIALGNVVYWDEDGDPLGGTGSSGAATTRATGNILMGRCMAAAGDTDTTVDVELTIGVETGNNLENIIADPGNGNPIPVTVSGNCPLVTAGAETRTIAIPTFVGQQLLVYCKTFVGNAVVTVASAINETGNTIITYSATGQACLLTAAEDGAALVWRAVVDGAGLS